MPDGAARGSGSAEVVILKDNTARFESELEDAIAGALEEIGIVAEGDAKRRCPVDTGRLRNSITHALDGAGKCVMVGTNVEYAVYVHEGTSRHAGTPFLRDAVQSNQGRFQAIVKKHLQGI